MVRLETWRGTVSGPTVERAKMKLNMISRKKNGIGHGLSE